MEEQSPNVRAEMAKQLGIKLVPEVLVDGNYYNIFEEGSHKFGFNDDYISVISADGLVGCAWIDHRNELITVSYNLSNGEESETTYNYYEYLDDSDARDNLARWMVSTHPES